MPRVRNDSAEPGPCRAPAAAVEHDRDGQQQGVLRQGGERLRGEGGAEHPVEQRLHRRRSRPGRPALADGAGAATRRCSTYSTASTTGRFTPKMARHPKAATASPPITGPRPAPTRSPSPAPRRLDRARGPGRARGAWPARSGSAPTRRRPAAARSPTSTQNDPATIAAAEKTPNPVVATRARRRAPTHRRRGRTAVGPTSIATRYSVTSTLAWRVEMSKSFAISGSATAIIVEFNGTRAEARAIPAMVVAGTTPSPSAVIRGSSPRRSCRRRAPAWRARGGSCRRTCRPPPGCPSRGRRWRRGRRSCRGR